MKTTFLMVFCALMLAPSLHYGQTNQVNKFYKKYKIKNQSMNMTIPGWLIDIGASVAMVAAEDQDEKAALRLAKKVKQVKLLMLEDSNKLKSKDIDKLFVSLRQNSFEDLIQVRDKDARVNVMIREDQDVIRNLFVLVRESEEMVMVSMKTKLTMDQINDMLNLMEDELDIDIN